MNGYRTILHSDLNCFFASVEIALNPALRGKAVAVCGSQEDRHGIVLAKSEPAKRAGVKTGMANWQAQQLCPDLIIVPPHYEQYQKYSLLVKEIYARYTDQIEPYGMDECWLDVTHSRLALGEGTAIAEEIRQSVKRQLHLTVSIGVSFNKIFAKLGSDMKKPDAITVITPEDFRAKVWPLPTSHLLFVGRATARKLHSYGIRTIGELAHTPPAFLHQLLGKHGDMLWSYANGLDRSRVMPLGYRAPYKSISHGTTCISDLASATQVWQIMLHLAQTLGTKLRRHQLTAGGVSLCVRDSQLAFYTFNAPLEQCTQSPLILARACFELFLQRYAWRNLVRAVTVGATKLQPASAPRQLSLFALSSASLVAETRPAYLCLPRHGNPIAPESDAASATAVSWSTSDGDRSPDDHAATLPPAPQRSSDADGERIPWPLPLPEHRREKLDDTIEQIRQRFGRQAIVATRLLAPLPLPKVPNESRLPGKFYI